VPGLLPAEKRPTRTGMAAGRACTGAVAEDRDFARMCNRKTRALPPECLVPFLGDGQAGHDGPIIDR